MEPRLIVADEPVSALDVSVQAQVLNLMKSLQEEHSLSLIIISHDLAVVRYLAGRIGVLYLGKLVEVGSAEALYKLPAHHYTKSLIDAVPVPDPAVSAAQTRRLLGRSPQGSTRLAAAGSAHVAPPRRSLPSRGAAPAGICSRPPRRLPFSASRTGRERKCGFRGALRPTAPVNSRRSATKSR